MMNDKIRLAADVLAALGSGVNSQTFEMALRDPKREEFLRSAFLAGVRRTDLKDTMESFLKALRAEIDKSEGRVEAGAAAMLEMLEDEDVITPADRAAAASFMTQGQVSASMKYPKLLAAIERVWSPTYDPKTAMTMWLVALQPDATIEGARRLADRTDADSVPMAMLAEYANNLPALEVLVGRMSPAALARNCDIILGKIEEKKGWAKGKLDSAMLVHLVQMANTPGVDLSKGIEYVDALMNRGEVCRRIEEGFPYLARFLQLTSRLDDPRLFEAMIQEGLETIGNERLVPLLQAGMPVSRVMPATSHRTERMVHLLEQADLDQIPLIAPYMSAEDKVDFVRCGLAERLRRVGWIESGSCVGENIMTVLRRAGFDLGVTLNDKGDRLHEIRHSMGASRKYIFTTLHALGVYPPDLRMDGLGPLHYAAFHNDGATIEALAKRGYDINDASEGKEEAPLVTALKYNQPIAVRALLALGADVGVKAKSGASLLQIAKDDEVKRLIRAARTGQSVTSAMGAPEGGSQKKGGSFDPSVL